MNKKNIFMLSLLAGLCLPAMAQYEIIDSVDYKSQTVDVGANRTFTREQSTAAVSIITNKDVNRRGANNIGNNIIGQGNGLVSLQGAGLYNVANPTFYVRGLQSLSTSSPLILVDGIERSIDNVISEDVESVTILKDAAATALYGYKGINGAILITTKHGQYNSKSITFSYDHGFHFLINKPKFVDAYTYASAVNEALANEGSAPRYSNAVLDSYRDGTNPLYYPNVNWADETFRNIAHTNKFNLEFKGGSKNFRYFTNLNLVTSKGFIKNFDANDGYSTQDKYTRATIRSNMDMDLGPKTKMQTHLFGILSEQATPGSQANLWNMVYTVPANAFPVKATEDGVWGGNGTYTTQNPVAQSSAAAYYKNHQRALYADAVLEQDLGAIYEGLSFKAQLGYDTHSNLYEDHSKTYRYGSWAVAGYTGGVVDPTTATLTTDGEDTDMGTGANNNSWARRAFYNLSVNFDRTYDKHAIYGQLKYDYEFSDYTGTNTTVYRQNYTLFGHYGYDNRYMADLALVYSGSSRLAKGSKWALSPTFSASWNIHNEEFMKDLKFINFLKLRASIGLLQSDILPGDNVWTYYDQFYTMDGVTYPFYSYGSGFGRTYIAQAATQDLGREKAVKFNVGFDATLLEGLNVSFDYYVQQRKDIWVSTAGAYTGVFGLTTPYENLGKVNSHGFELAVDYSKQIGDWAFNAGATLNLNKNTIKEQAEEPRLYSNLESTGLPLSQLFGYEAQGFFQKSDDLDGNGIISAAECTTLGYPVHNLGDIRPGDVRYADVNGDGQIDANDRKAIGYNTVCPELIYGFHLGAAWKGAGIDAVFQGVGRYTGVMNTNGMYRAAISNNTLSQYLYDNSWSAERGNTEGAKFPRLSSTANANNDQTSTLNMFDRSYFKLRSVELFYNIPDEIVKKSGFLGKAKVYLRGTDLFTMDHLDEADAGSYGAVMPLTRSIQLGASVTF